MDVNPAHPAAFHLYTAFLFTTEADHCPGLGSWVNLEFLGLGK